MGHYECRKCDQRYDRCTCKATETKPAKGLREVVAEAAARCDAKPSYRMGIAAQAELARAPIADATTGTARTSTSRRFVLVRDEDVSGTSGTGVVVEGIEWSDGSVSVHWLSQLACHSTYGNIKAMLAVHGHGAKTRLEWIDT